jgi:integrase/recombinase XerC
MNSETALIPVRSLPPALQSALTLWADATTDSGSERRRDLIRDKQQAISSFFSYLKKTPGEVEPPDVKLWQEEMERLGLARTTIYNRISLLSSFYWWAMRDRQLSQSIQTNPALLARPKAPKAYQTEATKALSDKQLGALLSVVAARAASGEIVGKRDYALLLFYVLTGMRRQEVISLRGKDLEFEDEVLIVRCKMKGGDYVAREITAPEIKEALLDYLRACNRLHALKSDAPLWTRHDRAGKAGTPLLSHAFAHNLKKYAREAGIDRIHLHQLRHSFARIVAEETGSITETQEALMHRHAATTRIYVQRIAVRRDKHSRTIADRLKKH